MIQFRRGTLSEWLGHTTPLADGQPGYDKTTKKLKIGDGQKHFSELPYVSGLFEEEILNAETEADNKTLFTYGNSLPNGRTKGKVYLQQFEGAIEADFVVETGRDVNYFFRKWNSGFIECWGKGEAQDRIKNLFSSIIFDVKTGDYFEMKGFWK